MSNDPTYKTIGYLWINVINNGTYYRANIPRGAFSCPHKPQHIWVENEDYYLNEVDRQQPPQIPIWTFCSASVKSRGPDAVAKGDIYHYEVTIQNVLFRVAVDIVGVGGGSVVQPSIGLYNLLSHPNDWTYFKPERFSGEWGLQVINSNWPVPVGISALYNPGQVLQHDSWSTLNFKFDNYPWLNWYLTSEEIEFKPGASEVLAGSDTVEVT